MGGGERTEAGDDDDHIDTVLDNYKRWDPRNNGTNDEEQNAKLQCRRLQQQASS